MSDTLTITVPIGRDIPDHVGVGWCAEVFGLSPTAVQHAINSARLPAEKISGVWLIKPEHAARLWGHRLFRDARDD